MNGMRLRKIKPAGRAGMFSYKATVFFGRVKTRTVFSGEIPMRVDLSAGIASNKLPEKNKE